MSGGAPSPSRLVSLKNDRFCVIGAGASGLCMAKYLKQTGLQNFVIYESGTQIGGLWCYGNDNNESSAYKTLHINTPKHVTNFSDFKFADDVQMFPNHRDMHDYLVAYATHFGLVPHIRFKSRVADVRPAPDYRPERPRWAVTTQDGRTDIFDCVIVASGHLSQPMHDESLRSPFAGEYLHTHDYREPAPYVGKRVCVVGAGNSACDIAADICMTAERTVLVARSGVVIAPKLICGVPFHDVKLAVERRWIPKRIRDRFMSLMIYILQGRMTDLGFKPLTKRAHGTSNPVIVPHIRYRRITVKQGIDRIEGKRIHFVDGTSEEFDVVMAGTGYRITVPFLSDAILPIADNSPNLYKRVASPDWAGLHFIGFLNTGTVSLLDAFEHQVQWLVPFLTGEAVLPDRQEMLADIQAKKDFIARHYIKSLRHGIEENFMTYYPELKRSQKEGLRRRQRLRGRQGGAAERREGLSGQEVAR